MSATQILARIDCLLLNQVSVGSICLSQKSGIFTASMTFSTMQKAHLIKGHGNSVIEAFYSLLDECQKIGPKLTPQPTDVNI